jgi:hypothetical protein
MACLKAGCFPDENYQAFLNKHFSFIKTRSGFKSRTSRTKIITQKKEIACLRAGCFLMKASLGA